MRCIKGMPKCETMYWGEVPIFVTSNGGAWTNNKNYFNKVKRDILVTFKSSTEKELVAVSERSKA